MYNYPIDTSLLPKVWLTWESTKNRKFDKRYWLNCQTGEKKNTPESWMTYEDESSIVSARYDDPGAFGLYKTNYCDNIWVKSGTKLVYPYVKYHADIDQIEIAEVEIPTTRKEEVHGWKYTGDRYFVNRNKTITDINGIEKTGGFRLNSNHIAPNTNTMFGMLTRLHKNEHAIDEFKKFIGGDSYIIGSGRVVQIKYIWHIQEWHRTSQKVRGKGREQKLTDMLVAIPLSDVSDLGSRYPIVEYGSRFKYIIRGITYFERCNDTWSVLRVFNRNFESVTEICRMYIGDNGKTRIVAPSDKGWVPSQQPSFYYNNYTILVNKDEAIAKCNRIKYAAASLEKVEAHNFVYSLMTALRFPEVEQLFKIGYEDIARSMAYNNTPKAYLKGVFGEYYNDKEKNILRKIGLTKHQLDIVMSNINHGSSSVLCQMRDLFGDDLSHMDTESFNKNHREFE